MTAVITEAGFEKLQRYRAAEQIPRTPYPGRKNHLSKDAKLYFLNSVLQNGNSAGY